MRAIFAVPGLGVVLLLAGCADSKWSLFRHSQDTVRLPTDKLPTAMELVTRQNTNARQIPSFICTHLELDCESGGQSIHIPDGKLACQKPRNFCLQAEVLGRPEALIGSNQDEFWYWVKRGDPYLIHCSYQDLANGGVRLPFPFQPEWVIEALGMSEYDMDPAQYVVQPNGRTIQLIQTTRNLQGQPVRKVTEFNPTNLRVAAHILQSASGKEICRAQIDDMHDLGRGIVLPRKIAFTYPAEGFKMKMLLGQRASDINIYQQLSPQQAELLFRRPNLSGVQNYDLARGPEGPNQLAPVGGLQR
ncbi:MAG TPA: hypothetical protein VKU02_06190 [Gemmataceae bacterium]|nr:hypothetical protein [Gemmataceae bacterium]